MTRTAEIIRTALAEDLIGGHDVTTDLFVPATVTGRGRIISKQDAVVSGVSIAAEIFLALDSKVETIIKTADGSEVSRGTSVLDVAGPTSALMRGERTALNFIGRLSGIATTTRQFVTIVAPWKTQILCTRKTTPGLREFEAAAVVHGGGSAYRTNLSDSVLVKDNHLAIVGGMKGIRARLDDLRKCDSARAERLLQDGKIEADSIDEAEAAVAMGWRHILLDNFSPEQIRHAVARWGSDTYLEASGGITLDNVAEYAATGVHAISVGMLTHSSPSVDFSLEVEWRHS